MRGRPRTGQTPRQSYRLPAATLEQIQQLRERMETTSTAVIVLAIERLQQGRNHTMKDETCKACGSSDDLYGVYGQPEQGLLCKGCLAIPEPKDKDE